MTSPIDDDESYLVPNTHSDEAVWCKIGNDGELEFVDWVAIQSIANEYDLSSTEKLTQAYRLLMQFKLRLEDGKFHPCKNCDGTGTINRNSLGDPQFDEFCPECNGDGLTE
jgi:hypothetical protein